MSKSEDAEKTEKTRIVADSVESENLSWIANVRQSPKTATFLCFIVLVLDAMLLTSLEPILPDIVSNIKGVPDFLKDDDVETNGNDTDTDDGSSASSLAVGIVFSAKPFVELLSNAFVGMAVDRFGYNYPLHIGYVVSIVSAMSLAFADTYVQLFISRCIQGIGNALLVISMMAFMAYVHGDTPERSSAFAITFIGVGLGAIVGFPYGGLVYEYVGREYPYLILGILMVVSYSLKLAYKPNAKQEVQSQTKASDYLKMVKDFYVVAAPILYFAVVGWTNLQFGISGILLSLPLLAEDELNAGPVEIGIVFLVTGVIQAVVQVSLANYTQKIGWWKLCFSGSALLAVGMCLYTQMNSIWWCLLPNAIGGLSMGLFYSSFHAMLCHITDVRIGPNNYGAAFSFNKIGLGIGNFAGSLGFSALIDKVDFNATFLIAAGIIFVLSFSLFLVRNVPSLQEEQPLTKAKE